MSERELCKKCGFPDKFCKHTIEKEFQELCPDTPLDKESVWQLVESNITFKTAFVKWFMNEIGIKKEIASPTDNSRKTQSADIDFSELFYDTKCECCRENKKIIEKRAD